MSTTKHTAPIEYVRNESLPTVNPEWKGNPFSNGVYFNENYRFQPGPREILKWQRQKRKAKKRKQAHPFSLPVHSDTSFLNKTNDVLVWMGHASFYLRLNGKSLLLDPCYSKLPFIHSYTRPAIQGKDLFGLDHILYSHAHRDHFDIPSLKQLLKTNPEVRFLLPLGMGKLLERHCSNSYQEAGWYQQFEMEGIRVVFLPARHWNRRGLFDFNSMLWGGYWIEWTTADGTKKSIYFTGDTAYDTHFKKIGALMGAPDLALMPVGAYQPDYVMQSSHTSPQEAIQAYQEVGGKRFVPMHYGTYDLSDEPPGEPLEILENHFKNNSSELLVPEMGQALWLDQLWEAELEGPTSIKKEL